MKPKHFIATAALAWLGSSAMAAGTEFDPVHDLPPAIKWSSPPVQADGRDAMLNDRELYNNDTASTETPHATSRAEVRAEMEQARREGTLDLSDTMEHFREYTTKAPEGPHLSREEVREQARERAREITSDPSITPY